jgi:hypothetical protein
MQVNKFKVQLTFCVDVPLVILNLCVLWIYKADLITNPIFLTSLIIAVFR